MPPCILWSKALFKYELRAYISIYRPLIMQFLYNLILNKLNVIRTVLHCFLNTWKNSTCQKASFLIDFHLNGSLDTLLNYIINFLQPSTPNFKPNPNKPSEKYMFPRQCLQRYMSLRIFISGISLDIFFSIEKMPPFHGVLYDTLLYWSQCSRILTRNT